MTISKKNLRPLIREIVTEELAKLLAIKQQEGEPGEVVKAMTPTELQRTVTKERWDKAMQEMENFVA